MSHHTHVQLSFEGGDFFVATSDEKVQPMLAAVAAAFDLHPPRGVNPFYVDSPSDWFTDKLLLMSGYSDQAEEFLKYMSIKFPGVTFRARGMGEEFEDIWAVSYLHGALTA